MSLTDILEARHSCRAYLDAPVPDDVIEQLFALAQKTPSWCNTQPWQAYVTSGESTQKLGDALLERAGLGDPAPDIEWPPGYPDVYGERRRESGYALYAALGIERSDYAARTDAANRNLHFFGAPHTAIITTAAALGTYGAVDCGGYVAVLALAAQELGLGAIPQAAIAAYSDVVRAQLSIPEEQHILCAVSFGYEDTEHVVNSFRTSRAPLAETLHRV
jgi:nitroreductase